VRRWRPLRGVRVLSFEAAFSLPAGTRVLADLGAEVVRVGWPGGTYGTYIAVIDGIGLNKRTIGIDLRAEAGKALARRLVAQADIVCNNFRPPVLRQYGLDAEALRAIKPELIVLQFSGYGTPGPWQDFPAYGPSVEAAGGMNAQMGEASDPPMRVGSGVFADQAAGRYAALALLDALAQRRATGQGRTIDLSMYEVIVHLVGDTVLAAAHTGEAPPRRGNRDPRHAPQGIYRCAGPGGPWRAAQGRASQTSNDDWLALSVQTDAQWRALRTLLADETLTDPALDCAEGRLAQHGRIDAAIAAWAAGLEKGEAAARLQAVGVPAGLVQRPRDLPLDAQLLARGAFQPVQREAPLLGRREHAHLTLGWGPVGAVRPPLRPERPIGADNRRVLRRWLGLSAAEVRELERSGALLRVRPPEVTVPPNQIIGAVDPDFARRLGLPETADEAAATP
jgi:crotonobetainyl-CoA:carnitine CoA-transferase CaiB-like acyl-CoA transferase